jgi:phosphoglycerate dehydrogenase-like enzyme
LVIAPGKLQNVLPLIAADYRVVSLDDIRSKPGPVPEIVAAIIGHGGGALPEDILARLPGLAVVGIAGLSLRHYGPEALFARGVSIVNASEAYAKTVAELVLGLALLGRRRAFLSHEVMRKGGWGTTPHLPGFRGLVARTARAGRTIAGPTPFGPYLKRAWGRARTRLQLPEAAPVLRGFSGVTVGIVGWSANARAFVELLRPFGAQVKVFSEHASAEEVLSAGAVKGSLGEVLKAEIVSLHRSLNEKTRHSLGAAELELLRPGAVLINTARGGLIDEKALVARLRRGDVSACLDTYESEPLPRSHPLRKMSNVFLTAHIAGGTSDMHAAAARDVVRKVLDYLSGKDVKTVSREQWEMMS